MELLMQKRTAMHEGYMLEESGGTIGMAVRTHDISIPSYREEMRKRKLVQLTQDNGNGRVAELHSTPPTRDACQMLIEAMDARRDGIIEKFQAEIKTEEIEMKDTNISRGERGYMRLRVKALQETILQMLWEAENVSADDLYRFFRTEDIQLRAKNVSPEMRESLSVLREEQEMFGIV